MKAAIRRNYGSPDQITIESVERPVPKDNEVLIKVHATTVSRTDCANLTARPFIMRFFLGLRKPRKIILGTDFAGEVAATGKNVDSVRIGDKVFGFNDMGSESQAEYLTTSMENVFPVPDQTDLKQAAASLEGAHYAYSFIQKAELRAGQRILINGATGGIGSALLQFVRPYDVRITATCNTKNIGLIRSLGADRIYDYTREDFTKDPDHYDYIFDTVGKSTFGKCRSLLQEKGVYMSSELGPYSQNVYYPLLTSMSGKKVVFPIPYNKNRSIPYIIDHLQKSTFRPVIDREFALEELSGAYQYVMTGQKTGNVVIKI